MIDKVSVGGTVRFVPCWVILVSKRVSRFVGLMLLFDAV